MTAEQEKLICENNKLMYWSFEKAAKRYRHVDRDELLSAAGMALLNTALRFDSTRGFSFSTLYALVYHREICNLLRSMKNKIRPVSLDEPLYYDRTTNAFMCKADLLPAKNDTEREAISRIELAETVENISALTKREQACVVSSLRGIERKETARLFGVSEWCISDTTRRARERLRAAAEGGTA